MKFKPSSVYILFELLFFLLFMETGRCQGQKHSKRYIQKDDLIFDYKKNGQDWGTKFPQCNGEKQSPIKIKIPLRIDGDVQLEMKWSPYTVEEKIVKQKYTFSFSGHMSKIEVRDVNGKKLLYRGKQIEIHAPPEHDMFGDQHDVEVHIIHDLYGESKLDTKNEKAIIVLFFQAVYKAEDAVLFDTFDVDLHGQRVQLVPSRDLGPYFSEKRLPFYTYQGSRTRPPCTEDVNWFLIDKTFQMSLQQLKKINKFYKDNFDFAQKKGNNRAVIESRGRLVQKGIVIFGGQSLIKQQIQVLQNKRTAGAGKKRGFNSKSPSTQQKN